MDNGAKSEVSATFSTAELLAALEAIPEVSAAVIRAGFWDEVGQHICANPEGLRLIAVYALRASLLSPGKIEEIDEPMSSCTVRIPSAAMLCDDLRFSVVDGFPEVRKPAEVISEAPACGILFGVILAAPWIVGVIWIVREIASTTALMIK